MLLALAQWLQNDASFMRVFIYITFRAVMATIDGAVDRPRLRTVR